VKKVITFLIFLIIAFFFFSCQQQISQNQVNAAIEKYVYVWNGGDLDSLDGITSENFQLRINPTFEAMIGRDKLKKNILRTRSVFPDFTVKEKDIVMLGDTALALTWTISGTYRNPKDSLNSGGKTEAEGFSVIFFHDGILTGEWIGYSDLTWYKNLGYELVLPKKR
jgi:hypothetical protein